MYNDNFLDRRFRDHGFHNRNLQQRNYWNDYAEMMELTVEGNRLLSREIAKGVGHLWQTMKRWLSDTVHRHGASGHARPPI
jgi:hypothetical protein